MSTSLTDVDWSKLPQPQDGGEADHLLGAKLPNLALSSTDGGAVNLASLSGLSVIYIYPLTGRPDAQLPDDWDMIPGARGCTPQSCAFRDHFAELKALGVDHLFGLSAQDTDYQKEAATRMHLPFALLSDAEFAFRDALGLPHFEADGMPLLRRMTLIAQDAKITKVFFPVFPPDRNAADVMAWLQSNSGT